MELLRFTTAGSVDDGKSTLIGRILYETGNIKNDILQSVYLNDAEEQINLAHITDGLRSEREKGITIDVAYKYFSTASRKYIITDAPGHFQYVKNMITGASNVDAMIILVDALNGVTDQTKRHLLAAAFLGVSNILVAVNKMDAVGYDKFAFNAIKAEFIRLCTTLDVGMPYFVPISALCGDNVALYSQNMMWFDGSTILTYLENIEKQASKWPYKARFVVQSKIEAGYAGKVVNGSVSVGERVALSTNEVSIITSIQCGYANVNTITKGQYGCLYFADLLGAERGAIISSVHESPNVIKDILISLCWFDATKALKVNSSYYLRMHTEESDCIVNSIVHKLNPANFSFEQCESLSENDFALVNISLSKPVAWDRFHDIPEMGRGIFIDKDSNATVAAFTIRDPAVAR